MKETLLFTLLAILALLPAVSAAQVNLNLDYPVFGDINLNCPDPDDPSCGQSLSGLVGWLYYLLIGVAGLAAFAMILWGGFQYLTSAGNPSQISDARDRITKALLGLLLVFGSFLIIQFINPQLTTVGLGSPDLDVDRITDADRSPIEPPEAVDISPPPGDTPSGDTPPGGTPPREDTPPGDTPLPPSGNANLIFHSGFEPNTTGHGNPEGIDDITGVDVSVSPPNDWVNDLVGHPAINSIVVGPSGACGGISTDDMKVRIIGDPTGSGQGNVLHMYNRRTCTGSTAKRPRLYLGGVDIGDDGFHELYYKSKIYIHDDVRLMEDGPWYLQLFELKQAKDVGGGFFSIGFQITADLKWQWERRLCCVPAASRPSWHKVITNSSAHIPFGQWATFEMYWKKGTGTDGRFLFRIDGQTVFDEQGPTVNPDAPDRSMYQWKLSNVYTGEKLVDYVRDRGGALQIYRDDIELWDGIP